MGIENILSDFNEFIRYIAPGFLYLTMFYYSSYREREDKIEYLIFKAITISYVIKQCVLILSPNLLNNLPKLDGLLIITGLVSGLIIGTISRSGITKDIADSVFSRDSEENLYIEIMTEAAENSQNIYCKIRLRDTGYEYQGQIKGIYSPHKNTMIVLQYYKCKDKSGKELFDYTKYEDVYISIVASDIESFEYVLKSEEAQS